MMIIEMYKFFLFYKPKGRRGYFKIEQRSCKKIARIILAHGLNPRMFRA